MKNETLPATGTPGALHSSTSSAPVRELLTDPNTTPQERLIAFLEETLAPVGFELVTIEIVNGREKALRVFVDKDGGVGIEDCVLVNETLDLPLEGNAEIEAIFGGPYDLEVSSPGIDRPLRKPSDYARFSNRVARIFTFRPLTVAETGAETYTTKNPKQKNFYGIIRGFEHINAKTGSVLFGVLPEDGTLKTQKGKKKVDISLPLKNETLIRIPLGQISEANLIGDYDESK